MNITVIVIIIAVIILNFFFHRRSALSSAFSCWETLLGEYEKQAQVSNASVNSSGAHPTLPPRATVGHLLTLSVPGVGH